MRTILDVVYELLSDIGQTLTYSVVGTLPPFATFATKSGKGIVTETDTITQEVIL